MRDEVEGRILMSEEEAESVMSEMCANIAFRLQNERGVTISPEDVKLAIFDYQSDWLEMNGFTFDIEGEELGLGGTE